jgi:cytochrome c oxidase cbb3-type subunit 3
MWLHGCDFNSVFDIIKNGKPTKGMTAFKSQMTDVKIQKVTSYIISDLVGSNPPNAKDPQGKKCN